MDPRMRSETQPGMCIKNSVATEAEEEVEIDFSFSAESAALPFAHAEVELVHDAHGWLDIPLNGPCGGSVRVQLKHIPAEQAMYF